MNTDALWPSLDEAEQRVLDIQTKLHQWAIDDPNRRFDDLHNLVCDPAFLVVAWSRIRGNRGARTAGVDGVAPRSIVLGGRFLVGLRADLKTRRFVPLPVREKLIPKRSGKLRGLGIPTARDRTVQAALKLVLEPIFEADFKPCSYGFRPRRRAHDAIAEIVHMTTGTRNYEWVLEGDIKACFDEIDHTASPPDPRVSPLRDDDFGLATATIRPTNLNRRIRTPSGRDQGAFRLRRADSEKATSCRLT